MSVALSHRDKYIGKNAAIGFAKHSVYFILHHSKIWKKICACLGVYEGSNIKLNGIASFFLHIKWTDVQVKWSLFAWNT